MDERYKKRGLRFNNTLDSRVLRAVHNQQRQRGRRDEVVNSRRQMEVLQDSPHVSGPSKNLVSSVDKQAMQYQKGLERYQQLLKWKEMKKKQLEKEKKKRMPAFKTGIYQPSPPRFLVSADQKELGMTPQGSLKKKVATPGASLRKVPVFHLGGTPATSLLRMPQFHTGLTPGMSSRKQILTSRKHKKQEDQGASRRTRGALKKEGTKNERRAGGRGHTARLRKLKEQEDLGVQPLPLTPPVAGSKRKMEKPVPSLQCLPLSSFAPTDFAFNFEVPQIPRIECPSTACPGDPLSPPHMEEVSQDHSNDKKEDCELTGPVGDILINKEDAPVHQKNSSFHENDDAKISEIFESEIQHAHQNNSLQEEKDGYISETCESKIQPAKQNTPLEHNEHAGISQTDECEIEPELDKENVNEILTDELVEDFKPYKNLEADNHPELSNDEKPIGEDSNVSEHKEGTGRNQMIHKDDCMSHGMHTSSLEVHGGEKSKPKKSSRATTPARYFTRRSVACCFDGTVTPTVSRLRPRTPCSRSTRRSLSAHCDSPWELYTPGRRSSARKTPRYSVSKAAKLKDLDETHDASTLPVSLEDETTAAGSLTHDTEAGKMNTTEKSLPVLQPHKTTTDVELKFSCQKEPYSPLMTPENAFRREQGMWTVETSPWITSQRSKKKKKDQTISGLHGMFDDVPTDGSPLPPHLIPSGPVPVASGASVGEDTVCTNLLSLLQPSIAQNTNSPEVDVWGEETLAINELGTPNTSNLQQPVQGKKTLLEETASVSADMQIGDTKVSVLEGDNSAASEPPAASINILTPGVNGNEKAGHRRGSRKSRKSVMFAIAEQENMKSYKLSGTPVRKSSRVSVGLFAKIDLNVDQPIIQDQDLMAFESPISEKKMSCTRRRSSRISLLPGMTPSPPKEMAASLPTDLMTWDSPDSRRTSKFAASSLATPLRRSRRLSKAV